MLAADASVALPIHSFIRPLMDSSNLGQFAASCLELAARGRSAPRRFHADTPALLHRSRGRQISFKIRIVFIFFLDIEDSENM